MDHDEKKLKEAFNKYLKEQSESNFMDVLQLMRDTDVWIPCVAVLSENDQKKWEEVVQKAGDDVESLVGMSLSTEDAVRLVPDVLQNENGYFFPVFTSPNEMGDYGDGLSKTQNAFLEAVTLAKNNEKNVRGIVVNPFTDALVLDRQLFDVFEHLEPGIKKRRYLFGAILGDMIGSPYEWHSTKRKDFKLFGKRAKFTDDTVMTVAVIDALMEAKRSDQLDDEQKVKDLLIDAMHKWGGRYPHAGYGRTFHEWLAYKEREPYNSWGNGSAMRVSAAGWIADDMETVRRLARWSAEVTHNHPEGVKGAEAVAAAILLARMGCEKKEIKEYIVSEFGYDLDRTCDEIRPTYKFDVSCQGSVPEAIIAFLEGNDFEDVIRTAVSLGGDSDTIGAMAGSIAEAYYDIPGWMIDECARRLPNDIKDLLVRCDFLMGV